MFNPSARISGKGSATTEQEALASALMHLISMLPPDAVEMSDIRVIVVYDNPSQYTCVCDVSFGTSMIVNDWRIKE